jgi:hypothetical protein
MIKKFNHGTDERVIKMNQYNDDTCFLFARPNFLYGFASAMDLGGTLVDYNASTTIQEADMRAIASDWAITGADIQKSVTKFAEENAL